MKLNKVDLIKLTKSLTGFNNIHDLIISAQRLQEFLDEDEEIKTSDLNEKILNKEFSEQIEKLKLYIMSNKIVSLCNYPDTDELLSFIINCVLQLNKTMVFITNSHKEIANIKNILSYYSDNITLVKNELVVKDNFDNILFKITFLSVEQFLTGDVTSQFAIFLNCENIPYSFSENVYSKSKLYDNAIYIGKIESDIYDLNEKSIYSCLIEDRISTISFS